MPIPILSENPHYSQRPGTLGNTSLVLICRTAHSSNASLKAKQDIGQLTDIEPQRGRQPANLSSL
jgi:hypothetical protein